MPPYLGNLELRELNSLCHWPTYFEKMGPPRFWIGPAGTVTPLHCDFDDNIFAQVWGTKRIFLAPPHHDEFLYTREANPVLFGSPFDPEAPDFDRYPLARQATLVEVIVQPGDMLYIPTLSLHTAWAESAECISITTFWQTHTSLWASSELHLEMLERAIRASTAEPDVRGP